MVDLRPRYGIYGVSVLKDPARRSKSSCDLGCSRASMRVLAMINRLESHLKVDWRIGATSEQIRPNHLLVIRKCDEQQLVQFSIQKLHFDPRT